MPSRTFIRNLTTLSLLLFISMESYSQTKLFSCSQTFPSNPNVKSVIFVNVGSGGGFNIFNSKRNGRMINGLSGRNCNAWTAGAHWQNFGFIQQDWRGWGVENFCEGGNPLDVLLQSMEHLWSVKSEFNDSFATILDDAYDRASDNTKSTSIGCMFNESNSLGAVNLGGEGDVEWFLRAFDDSMMSILATIVHEAAHSDDKPHNGGNKCPAKRGCDTNLAYNGANAQEFLYLALYSMRATNTHTGNKMQARDLAIFIQNNLFVERPDIVLGDNF